MQLPIRNRSSKTLKIFIEPLCYEYDVPIDGEARVSLADGEPHSIDIFDTDIVIYDEGVDMSPNVEVLTKEDNCIVEAVSRICFELVRLGRPDVSDKIKATIEEFEKSEGYLISRARAFEVFHRGFEASDREVSRNGTDLPELTGNENVAVFFEAAGIAAQLNCVARGEHSFPDLDFLKPGVGPFDADWVRSEFERALIAVKGLAGRDVR